uniref:Alpha/beta hydrolase fold protein n=1 Tax=Mycobacterium sp. (strain JLS) TaxID=164757 RepID=A0A5Q5CLI2_MYCSJ
MTELTYTGSDGWPLYATVMGDGPALIMLHGGGPDHHSMRPLAEELTDRYRVILPDIRGYGRSVCADPERHTWDQYVQDVLSLMNAAEAQTAGLIGAGLGGTIALRACLKHSDRIRCAVVISPEDIEDDEAKAAETAMMEEFADRVRTRGIEAGWALYLPHLQPLIVNLVRDAIPRADAASVAAAAAIGHDRAFRSPAELAAITTPTLIIPGDDDRHPIELAHRISDLMPAAQVASVSMSRTLSTAEDMGQEFAPSVSDFLQSLSAIE